MNVEVDVEYYPKGRVRCKLLGKLGKGQREFFWVRLDRFNGTMALHGASHVLGSVIVT